MIAIETTRWRIERSENGCSGKQYRPDLDHKMGWGIRHDGSWYAEPRDCPTLYSAVRKAWEIYFDPGNPHGYYA